MADQWKNLDIDLNITGSDAEALAQAKTNAEAEAIIKAHIRKKYHLPANAEIDLSGIQIAAADPVENTRFQAQHQGASSRVIDTEIIGRDGRPYTVQWFSSFEAAQEKAAELNSTRGHAIDEPRCCMCGAQPAGGDPEYPRCGPCWSKLANEHG